MQSIVAALIARRETGVLPNAHLERGYAVSDRVYKSGDAIHGSRKDARLSTGYGPL